MQKTRTLRVISYDVLSIESDPPARREMSTAMNAGSCQTGQQNVTPSLKSSFGFDRHNNECVQKDNQRACYQKHDDGQKKLRQLSPPDRKLIRAYEDRTRSFKY